MGELHLEVLIRRLHDEFRLDVHVGKPQVVYRETIQREAEVTEVFERDIAGTVHYAAVRLAVVPAARETGVTFATHLPEAEILPLEVLAAVRQGVLDAASSGVVQGYPVVDVQ